MKIRIDYYTLLLAGIISTQHGLAQTPNESGKKNDKRFSIAIIPDTQYNTKESQGGTNALFEAQVDWILANREHEQIAYVIHLGDITDDGDQASAQWENAAKVMYKLEKPLPGLPHGIPYGLAVGNHDQYPSQLAVSGTTRYFNTYFGVDHFKGRPYYGGNFRNDNDSHYDLFTAGGTDFIVLYIEFDAFDEQQEAMNNWASAVLEKYSSRRAIVVTHYTLFLNPVAGSNIPGRAPFSKQAKRLYDRLKAHKNLFMMAGGHVGDNGEGFRQDTYNGVTVKSFLSDYQSRPMGGNGMMRLMTFDLETDNIQVRTFSPYHHYEEVDGDSHFKLGLFREAAASRIYDFDLDGKSDLMKYQAGNWFDATGKLRYTHWNADAIPTPSYFEGNAQTQAMSYNRKKALFVKANGEHIFMGPEGAIPVPADYDGDGIADLAVWDPGLATWFVQEHPPLKHGWSESTPVPADYDGDGAAEKAVWRWSNQTWYIAEVGNIPFGEPGDIPVPADYNGDGKAEIAVWRPATGQWLIHGSERTVKLGKRGDLPIPGDYLGTGNVQFAVFDPVQKLVLFEDGKTVSFDATIQEVVNLPQAIKLYYLESLKK
ncbi:metallophosphoesterase [Sphingobacterium suaedae]|uniref:Metallophosphoesterase n=1 Tax=Sphingobacterium suaedae TaxID=1686402 RepID=A0ABW5KFV5_9SPHI